VSEAAFELKRIALEGPSGPLFQDVDWTIARGQVTALLGPAGTGKSVLLEALTGRIDAAVWRPRGEWRYRGRNLFDRGSLGALAADIAWSPQQTHAWGRQRRADTNRPLTLHEAAASPATTLLLDEPNLAAPEGARSEVARIIREQGRLGAVVLVTHDVGFAREVADAVGLLVAGKLVCAAEARAFFENPPTELARHFVSQGNCWISGPQPPPLPSHFNWILEGRLAGMGAPGLLDDRDTDLEAIAARGIEVLVTLTEQPFPTDPLRAVGISPRHFAIKDMGVPALGPTASLCRQIQRWMDSGKGVAVHCRAGMGRTGTILACQLVWMGRSAEEAIAEVRGVGRGYIQTKGQVQFVERFEASVRPGRVSQEGADEA